ncbi:ArnT family glycosyltransferase [Patescibacteria group bacterium]
MSKKIRNLNKKIRKWISRNRWEAFWLTLVLVVGAILRLYKIDGYMTFLGDEGRDAIIVRRLLVDFDPILIGPGTSIGNMYLGPLYYYMMAPFLLIFNFSPAGPAVGVALLGVLTIWLVWYVGRTWFGKLPALVAAFLFTISPAVITYSRSSWNPNIMPFFSLLAIYAVWKFWAKREYKWLVVTGVSIAATLQSHYLALLLVPIGGIFWLITLVRSGRNIRELLKYSAWSLIAFSLLMSPLVMFDARHGWINFASVRKFFTERQTTVSAKPWNALPKLDHVVERVSQALIHPTNTTAPKVIIVIFLLTLVWLAFKLLTSDRSEKLKLNIHGFWKRFNSAKLSPYVLLMTWLATAVFGLGVYKQEIYAHYYGFFFTGVFLLIGAFIAILQSFKSKYWLVGTLLIVGFVAYIQLQTNPLRYPPNNQLGRTAEVADKMIEISDGELFNIAVIAERNYEGAYQYFLEREDANFVVIDSQREETVADQLIVVCELPKDKCDPVHNDKAEVANFGWSAIEKEHSVAGVTIYKLIHTK